jgi:hypothetical protein
MLHRIQAQTAPHRISLMCRLEAAHLSKRADALRDLERKAKAKEIRESLQDKKKGLGRAYTKLQSGTARPIGFLRGPTGRVTAHPAEVDAIVQEAWNPVYQGQAGQRADIVAHFLAKYKDYICHGDVFQVRAITGERLLQEFRNSAATAASWDQWEHGEWAVMPVEAADWLAKLLTLVEEGAPWPRPTTWGKAFFLCKTEEPSTDPMEYKILLILSRLYRRWASMRLRDVHGWAQGWQLPEMYAGVPGGAQSWLGGTSVPPTRRPLSLATTSPARQ